MLLRAGVLSHPKRGNSAEENEDAHHPKWIKSDVELENPFVCAVADGANETSYSSLWANMLVETFADCRGDEDEFESRLPALRAQWKETVHSKSLLWYAEEKVAKGAFATLLGVTVRTIDTRTMWHSIAVGDSCLFHVREHRLRAVFPSTTVEQLRERPTLLSSNPAVDAGLLELVSKLSGELVVGDRLYLVTDAVAAWILSNLDTDSKPFDQIDQMLRTKASFPEWLEHLWETRSLKNDDCTILWIEAVA